MQIDRRSSQKLGSLIQTSDRDIRPHCYTNTGNIALLNLLFNLRTSNLRWFFFYSSATDPDQRRIMEERGNERIIIIKKGSLLSGALSYRKGREEQV